MKKFNSKLALLFFFFLVAGCQGGIQSNFQHNSNDVAPPVNISVGDPIADALEPMKKAALAKDVEGVLGYFEEEARERYRGLFAEMGDELAQVFEEMAPPKLKSIEGNVAIYETIRRENGEYRLYEIRFIRDPETNRWYIDSM